MTFFPDFPALIAAVCPGMQLTPKREMAQRIGKQTAAGVICTPNTGHPVLGGTYHSCAVCFLYLMESTCEIYCLSVQIRL